MTSAIEEIQSRYIAALRELQPQLDAWWKALLDTVGEAAAYRRWPTGASGHPAFLRVFRDFYLEIEDLNESIAAAFDAEEEISEEHWGRQDSGGAPRLERPADYLIYDIEDDAPDVYILPAGLVFVPIGLDDDEETV